MFERLTQEAIGDRRPLGCPDDPAKERWPELWKWLSTTDLPGNRVKEPATILIRLADGGTSATVSDRAYGVSIDASTPHLADILDALEAAIANPSTVVRRNHQKDPKVRKRKSQN
jgi:hypothetical protein